MNLDLFTDFAFYFMLLIHYGTIIVIKNAFIMEKSIWTVKSIM